MTHNGYDTNHKWSALKKIAEHIKTHGSWGIPRDELAEFEPAVDDLIGAGVLVSEGYEVRFFHESLLDHVQALSWAESRADLVQLVLSTNQDLSHRSLVRQVLVYQQGTDRVAYTRSLRELLSHPDVRFHLKDVAWSVLRSEPNPTPELWAIVEPLIGAFGQEGHESAVDTLMMPAWFQYADSIGAVLQWAVTGQEKYRNLVAGWLSVAQRRDPDRVATILGALLPLATWREPARRLIGAAKAGSSVSYMELIRRALKEGLFDDGFQFTSDTFVYAISRSHGEIPWMAVRVLNALVERWFYLAEQSGDELRSVTSRDYALSDFLAKFATRQPLDYASIVLPHVMRVLRNGLDAGDSRIMRDPWAIRYVADKDEASDMLFVSLSEALNLAALQNSSEFRRLSKDLPDLLGTHSARFLLYRAWTANPERFAKEALGHLVDWESPFKCGYADSPYWVTRELLAAIHPYLSPPNRRFLEFLILEYSSEWERSKDGRQSRGHSQFVLLDGLNASLMSKEAKQRREELRRKFGLQAEAPQPVRVGRVPSPIPEAAVHRMNDSQWLGAMEKHNLDERRDWLRGGPTELASALQAAARDEPARFARLATRLPDDVNGVYPAAILMGIADTVGTEDAELVFDAIRRIHALPDRPAGRWFGKPLARLADTHIPADVLAIVSWYAVQDPDPASDVWIGAEDQEGYFGGDPLTAGINSVRGAAAEAISALVWPRAERVESLGDVLWEICNDPTAAVRSCAALAVLSVSRHDEAFGFELFKALVNGMDDRLLSTHYVERCLSHFSLHERASLVPLVQRMLRSLYLSVQEAGGRQAALMSLARSSDESLTNWALSAGPAARKGVAQVAAANISGEGTRSKCIEWLLVLFADQDSDVRGAAADWVSSLEPNQIDDGELLTTFLASAAFRDNPSPLLERLDESTSVGGAVILSAVQEVVRHRLDELVDYRTHLSGDLELIAKLILRTYASAEDHQTRRVALDLIDGLMAVRGSPMRRVVGEFE